MDDRAGRQVTGGSDDGAAGGAAPLGRSDSIQLGHNGRPAGTVDGAVDPAASAQALIGRIDDGISRNARDVALKKLNCLAVGQAQFHSHAIIMAREGGACSVRRAAKCAAGTDGAGDAAAGFSDGSVYSERLNVLGTLPCPGGGAV